MNCCVSVSVSVSVSVPESVPESVPVPVPVPVSVPVSSSAEHGLCGIQTRQVRRAPDAPTASNSRRIEALRAPDPSHAITAL